MLSFYSWYLLSSSWPHCAHGPSGCFLPGLFEMIQIKEKVQLVFNAGWFQRTPAERKQPPWVRHRLDQTFSSFTCWSTCSRQHTLADRQPHQKQRFIKTGQLISAKMVVEMGRRLAGIPRASHPGHQCWPPYTVYLNQMCIEKKGSLSETGFNCNPCSMNVHFRLLNGKTASERN